MSKSFRRLGNVVQTVLGVAAIAAFAKSCIDLGSDLLEVQNVVDVTFGTMSGAVDRFSKNAITQFGLSELTAKKYMGTYGAMAKSFGIVEEAGYQMSAAVTGLTGDVASFYNLSTDEAYTKLKSIFTGETESLKELGVVMTQTALDQYALNNGFGRTTAKMTEQEKVMLRYQFVMSALSDAQGDFARTSNSWANQVRVLSLQFQSLKATIGQGLINAFTPVIRVINVILAKLQTLAAYFRAFTGALFGDAGGGGNSGIAKAAESLGSAAGSSGAVADNMGRAAGAAKKLKDYSLGIDELHVLNPEDGGGGDSGGGGGGGAPDFGDFSGEMFGEVTVNPELEAAMDRITDAAERLKEAAKPTTDALKRLWNEGLAQLGKFTWTALKDFWDYFLVPLGQWALGEGFPRFINITNDFLKTVDWDKLNEALRNFWKALEPFTENVGEGLLWFYEHVLCPIAEYAVNTAIPDFLDVLTNILDNLNYCIEKLKPGMEWLGEKLDWLNKFAEKPVIKDIISPFSVENFLRTLPGFDVIMKFSDSIDTLQTLEKWYDEGVVPYTNKDRWNKNWETIPAAMLLMFPVFLGSWKQKIKNWWDDNVAPWFTVQKWNDLFNPIKSQLKQKWDETAGRWISDIRNWWNKHVSPWFTVSRWKQLYESIKSQLKQKWEETLGEWQINLTSWWTNDVTPWFTVARWTELYESIKSQLSQKWDETLGEWQINLTSWWDNDVSPWFTVEKWLGIYESIKSSLGTTWSNALSAWKTDIDNWWKNDVTPWFELKTWTDMMAKVPSAFSNIFQSAVNAARDQLNKLIDWVNDKLHIEFDGLEILGEEIIPSFDIQLFRIPHIPAFASGGIVNSGQLFVANESGPELVGKYGAKTGVMNNKQIVDAVSEGVAVAVANVMTAYSGSRQSDRPIELIVNLDGRTVSKAVYKSDRRSGFNFRPV